MIAHTVKSSASPEFGRAAEVLGFLAIACGVACSAVVVKRAGPMQPLAAIDVTQAESEQPGLIKASRVSGLFLNPGEYPATALPGEELVDEEPDGLIRAEPGHTKYFNGRPIRPSKTISMTVTGYSPDARSCPGTDDGYTATNHSVWTNGMHLVAADTRVLPFGSMVSVPGYAEGDVVPVLDRGGAIKGKKLDLLFPTHEIARQWGRKRIKVTVWEYADGLPAPKPTTRYPR